MLHWSIVTHAKAREDAQGFGLELCQLALTRIPRQVSRARLELSYIVLYERMESGDN